MRHKTQTTLLDLLNAEIIRTDDLMKKSTSINDMDKYKERKLELDSMIKELKMMPAIPDWKVKLNDDDKFYTDIDYRIFTNYQLMEEGSFSAKYCDYCGQIYRAEELINSPNGKNMCKNCINNLRQKSGESADLKKFGG